MALVSEVTSVRPSGLNHIDALLNDGPGWNWLTPARSVLYYTFSVASGNEVGNSAISGGVTAFNAAQQSACMSQLAYVAQLTGITFLAATSGTTADIHFANTNIITGSSTSGICSWSSGYSYDGSNTVTSYSTSAYVYLDNVEWQKQNADPVAGNFGYETLLHEFGHALGLKHPFEGDPMLPQAEDNTSNSVMSYTDSGGPYSTFRPYDVAALMWLYGDDGLGGSLGVSSPGVYLIGNDSANALSGGSGNDKLEGLAGNDTINGGSGVDTALYSGNLANYTLTRSGGTYTVRANSGTDGTDTLTNVESLKFADMTVNLTVQAKAAAAPQADVNHLAELYVAFFNRVPDANGLSYWIDQLSAGKSLSEIAGSFYTAGVQFSNLTGFLPGMTDTDFINVFYKNVLGRSEGADAGGLAYWSGKLADHSSTRGSLGLDIVYAAHSYKTDPNYHGVADLLDNKLLVARTFAIDWGLGYNTDADTITHCKDIAAAVTSTSTDAAIALIGVTGSEMHLG